MTTSSGLSRRAAARMSAIARAAAAALLAAALLSLPGLARAQSEGLGAGSVETLEDGAVAPSIDGRASAAPTDAAPIASSVAGVAADEIRPDVIVTGGDFEPIVVALPRFRAVDPAYEAFAIEISDVIAADLERSGLFTVVGGPPLDSIDVSPDIDGWTDRGAAALIAGEVLLEPDGRLGVRFRLWDLREAEQRHQLKFLAVPTGARRVAHKVADIVYSEYTGEDPYFDTRIVFVEVRGPKEDRRHRLAIMDSDGENVTHITNDDSLVLTPRFSPATQEITFVLYRDGVPEIYLLNLTSERQELLGAFPGVGFAPRFSPDGEYVVLSIANEEGTDIYLLELATRQLQRLTRGTGIDTAPSFAPDGQQIAFESDRDGGQHIYVMDRGGANVRRISAGSGRYSTPVWSPTGDWIAFTKHQNGLFYIGVMRPDGSEERLLTSSYLDEGPTWAPNGRVIMFFREPPGSSSLPQLYTVDIFSGEERLLPTAHGASDPAWSPLLEN